MNKEQALQAFFESFKWAVYDENTVPDDASLPRITYMMATDSLDNPLSMTISLWDRSYSWESVTLKSKEISKALYDMYPPTISCDEGCIHLRPGMPFAQRMEDTSDSMIRRIYINLEVEYFTAY